MEKQNKNESYRQFLGIYADNTIINLLKLDTRYLAIMNDDVF